MTRKEKGIMKKRQLKKSLLRYCVMVREMVKVLDYNKGEISYESMVIKR